MKVIYAVLIMLFLSGLLAAQEMIQFKASEQEEIDEIMGKGYTIDDIINKETTFEKEDNERNRTLANQMVIITNSTLQSYFDTFAVTKRKEGIGTYVVTTTTTGSDSLSIRNWLRNQKLTNSNLKYVLLGGDETIIPTVQLPWTVPITFSTDYYYSNVLATWPANVDSLQAIANIPYQTDLIVGRIPVRTVAETQRFLAKYDLYMNRVDENNKQWKFIATNLDKAPGSSSSTWIINQILQSVGSTITPLQVTEAALYNSAPFDSSLVNVVQGCAANYLPEFNSRDFSFLYSINHGYVRNIAMSDTACNRSNLDTWQKDGHAMMLCINRDMCDNGYESYPAASYMFLHDVLPTSNYMPYIYWLISCQVANLRDPIDINISQALFNEAAGPISVISSSCVDYPHVLKNVVKTAFEYINQSGNHKVGDALEEGWGAFNQEYLNQSYFLKMIIFGHTIFGDPSMQFRTNRTEKLDLRFKKNAANEYVFSAADFSGNPVNGATITIFSNTIGNILYQGESPLNIGNRITQNLTVAASYPNYVTASNSIEELTSRTYSKLPYYTGFEQGADYNWEMLEGLPSGLIAATNKYYPYEGTTHLIIGKNSDVIIDPAINQALLHLNLTNEDRVKLSFKWKDLGDENDTEDGVFLSQDGGVNFVKVYDLCTNIHNVWNTVVLDLDALCDTSSLTYTSDFVIKFQQKDNQIIPNDGLAFDNIYVYSAYKDISSGNYATGFENGLDEFWSTQTSNSYGRVNIGTTNTPHGGTKHLLMDSNGGYSIGEAMLYLKMKDVGDSELKFWWKDFNDENHTQDGIYFSNNGGTSFVKVYSLTPASYSNNVWRQFTLAIDNLAASNSLTLTDNFVIKFSHYDNEAIANDGFAFDDIQVNKLGGGSKEDTPDNICAAEISIDNYPNPFNPTTTISFSLPESGNVEISVFNIKGQQVRTLVNSQFDKGTHNVVWNGDNETGSSVASGVYLYKLNVNGKDKAVKKCLLLK